MSDEVKRMHYFNGLFLTEDEFNLEQNYNIRMRRLHNRGLHSWGIVWGLDVIAGPGNKEITIKEGMALDKVTIGGEEVTQEIILTEDAPVDLSDYDNDAEVYIYIYYYEEGADVEPNKGGPDKIHWLEKPQIGHSITEPADKNKNIILSKVVIKDKIISDNIIYEKEPGISLRTYAGAYGKLTLPIEKEISSLPSIEGKKIGSQNGIQINSPLANFTGALTIKEGIKGGLHIGGASDPGDENLEVDGNCSINGNLGINGDAGIGTSAPNHKLEVAKDIVSVGDDGQIVASGETDKNKGLALGFDTFHNVGFIYAREKSVGSRNIVLGYPDGKVGIGTLSPSEKLEISGNIKAEVYYGDGSQLTGTGKWSDAATPAGSIYYDKGNIGIGTKSPSSILHISNANSTPIVKIEGMANKAGEGAKLRWTEFYSTDYGIEAFYESAKDLLIFRNIENNNVKLDNILVIDRKEGRVGIGTSAPNHKLEVAKDIVNVGDDGQIVASGETDTNKGLALGFDTFHNVGFIYAREKSVGSRNIVLGYPDGKVGIGTLNPSEKLEVSGNIKAEVYYGDGSQLTGIVGTSKWSDGLDPGSIYYNGNVGIGTTNPFWIAGRTLLQVAGSLTPAYVLERTGASNRKWVTFIAADDNGFVISDGGSSHRFKIDPKGYVGIGTMYPGYTLDVAGDIRFTGNLIGGGKGGYVMDQFVNKTGETLEQGDVVVIGENQSSLYYGQNNNIPIPEVDIAKEAYDTRICGIVSEVYTELRSETVEEVDTVGEKVKRKGGKKKSAHQQAFMAEELETLDKTKIESGQTGWMVTLGSYAHCKVDADITPIEIGDLLTTSTTKGHAQKVLEPEKAIGAIIGKALGSLREGKGKIPVLVILQ